MSVGVTILGYILLSIYVLSMVYITIYCLMQVHLLFHYQWFNIKVADGEKDKLKELPFVTIQLPIFNEKYVVERLIDNILKMDYPKDRFEVHILDDSTDETVEITAKKVQEYRSLGYNIEQITRVNRQGFKAGALRDAMHQAKGEFIAIFDADFLPRPDFLKKTLPYFYNEKVGVVQTRWEHINKDYSLLTRLQAMQLNVHFTVEQKGRNAANYLLQFNGTAGVWRRETIDDAGGWEADTLTEDLDLSYRAQMKGWDIVFREDLGSPAELPAEMNGLKSQQFRWMKGGAETAKKMLPSVWSSNLKLPQKIHATTHLLASSVFLSIFLMGFLSVPIMFFINPLGIEPSKFGYFYISFFAVITVYFVANVTRSWNEGNILWRAIKFFLIFPIFLALSMGLSLHNSVAVIQGFLGKKTPFVRTPKFGIKNITDTFKKKNYLSSKISWVTIFEGIMAIYFLASILYAFQSSNKTFLYLHLLLFIGFGSTFFYTIKHSRS